MAARNNRPRTSYLKEDNGDEVILWSSIVEKIKKAGAANKKYDELIPLGEENLWDNNESESVARLEEVEKTYREGLKLAEEELKILNEEPDDTIKNLETLISVRAAFETEAPRSASNIKSRNLKRRLDADGPSDSPAPTPDVSTPVPSSRLMSKAVSRSGSVAAPSVRSDSVVDTSDAMKGVVFDKQRQFAVGAEVFFKNNKKTVEGEGILCQVTSVIGDGKQRRYEVQDVEPELDENGREPSPYRASVQLLVAIPSPTASLPDLPKGKQVLALYPATTTFYKAEMVGQKKDQCRLRFEGEDEKDKEQDVDRRYVLDVVGMKA